MTIKGVEKIRRGRYRIVGVSHTAPRYPGAAVCGGDVFADYFVPEQDGDETLPASWESFCGRCLGCDPNGWATLRECVEEAPGFWSAAPS